MILDAILISLKVAIFSTTFTLILGVFLAKFFIKSSFKGKGVLEVFLSLPMVLPPSVIGYGLLIVIGKHGIIGKLFYDLFGITLLFNWFAASIAATIVSLPLMYQSCKAAFLGVDKVYINGARALGVNERNIFWRIILPLSKKGILGGIILAFARSIGEFGATLMVAGNIPGKTQTIPLAIYFAAESGDTRSANILVFIVVLFSFSIIYSLNTYIKKS